ncbi:MAG: hypothetical protein M1817_005443 [Caeruleum heppii]|nr:MAG: hypothetical protein M1817_005443 [Caeruleum heppii]
MPLARRIVPSDEEFGKRDDDYRPGSTGFFASPWLTIRGPPRWGRNKLLFGILMLSFLYLLYTRTASAAYPPSSSFENAPSLSPPSDEGTSYFRGWGSSSTAPGRPPAHAPDDAVDAQHYYNGPIGLYGLAGSAHAVVSQGGQWEVNRNVLFAAASLKSAAIMIPMACEMARWRRNLVHFAFMGREDLPITAILDVNGVGKECGVTWHDARPDFAPYSSELRMRFSVLGALNHIQDFMHPQVVIVDDSGQEADFLLQAVRDRMRELSKPVIHLPPGAPQNLMWITRLDTNALKAWDHANIDIVIHAPPKSAGTLIKLLNSLQAADYFYSIPPRLTIELPAEIDAPTQRYIENFHWPPSSQDCHQRSDHFTLRHRIPHKSITPEEASMRFLESFYPSHPTAAHVLVLSPNTELSPLFYHYVKYTLLEYKYTTYGAAASADVIGISLEVPLKHLNGSTSFHPPLPRSSKADSSAADSASSSQRRSSLYLWQAPNPSATLYFGDKWMEFHDFLGRRLRSPPDQKDASPPLPHVPDSSQPTWLWYLLELMRARGYSVLYPFFDHGLSLVTVHNELHHPPEERPAPSDPSSSDSYTFDESKDYLISSLAPERDLTSGPTLLSILPNAGDLPEIDSIPRLAHDGSVAPSLLKDVTPGETKAFRQQHGGCAEDQQPRKRKPLQARDLFCSDLDDDDDDEIEPAPEKIKYDEEVALNEGPSPEDSEDAEILAERPGELVQSNDDPDTGLTVPSTSTSTSEVNSNPNPNINAMEVLN